MAKAANTIRHVGGVDDTAYAYYPVVIIGAGESGIAMGCRLKQVLGFDQFRIFERRAGLGGTWYTNRYPGIACDIPAICYSFSFAQNASWTSTFPSGTEIIQYLYDVCEKFRILDKIQLNTSVSAIHWIDADEEWEVTLEHTAPGVGDMSSVERKEAEAAKGRAAVVLRTETVRAKVVVSAVGGLVEPKPVIKVPGMETFEGTVMHTARWDKTVDFKDKDVIVMGTGCSAAQVVPQLVKPEYGARSVTQLLRSPPWAVPFFPDPVVRWWKANMQWYCTNVPFFQRAVRKLIFGMMELEFIALFSPTEKARIARQAKAAQLLRYLKKKVPQEYHEIMIPDYEVFCKRRVVDEGWYESLREPNISITSLPLTRVHAKSVTLGPGRHYPSMAKTDSAAPTEEKTIPADVIVVATGYETGEWLHPLDVKGRGGQSLYDTWNSRGGSQAYMGLAMDGFPNFFILFGPNTATGHSSVILASENAANYTLKFIKPILDGDVRTWEVTEEAERRWTDGIQAALKRSVFMSGGCKSWYFKENGWNATVYPRTQIDFTIRCMFPRWRDWTATYTAQGLRRRRLHRILRLFAGATVLAALIYSVQAGRAQTRQHVANFVVATRGLVARGLDALRSTVAV